MFFNQIFESIGAVLMTTVQTGGDAVSAILVACAIGAAIAVLAGMAPSFTQGLAAGKAVEAVGRQPEASGQIRSTMLIGGVVAETGGIYGLMIAFLLLFVVPNIFIDIYIDAIQRL